MKALQNIISTINDDAVVIKKAKTGILFTSGRILKAVLEYENGNLVKNYSVNSMRFLVCGKIYQVIYNSSL